MCIINGDACLLVDDDVHAQAVTKYAIELQQQDPEAPLITINIRDAFVAPPGANGWLPVLLLHLNALGRASPHGNAAIAWHQWQPYNPQATCCLPVTTPR